VFTSHDRYFIQRVATQILVFSGIKKIRDRETCQWTLVPDLEQALRIINGLTQPKAAPAAKEERKPAATASDNKSNAAQPAKQKLTFNEKKLLDRLEAQIPELEEKLAAATEDLNAAYAEGKPFQVVQDCQKKVAALEAELETSHEKWEELYAKA
jgi:ATP-binding cassette subfamily F protein uup